MKIHVAITGTIDAPTVQDADERYNTILFPDGAAAELAEKMDHIEINFSE